MNTILDCGHAPTPQKPGSCGTGYGTDSAGKTACYECCAEQDRKQMREDGRITLYLSPDLEINPQAWKVTNWPGTLRFPVGRLHKGRHNIAGTRYDVWFMFDNQTWHGVQYGENTQVCHCKRVKS